mmetsp:Transcript_31027/g.77704  ORF Transcript_31027/g.77704 Transcript_31027/m.77704 type:complete len:353 (+) Transcript_31027:5336-6394(+)
MAWASLANRRQSSASALRVPGACACATRPVSARLTRRSMPSHTSWEVACDGEAATSAAISERAAVRTEGGPRAARPPARSAEGNPHRTIDAHSGCDCIMSDVGDGDVCKQSQATNAAQIGSTWATNAAEHPKLLVGGRSGVSGSSVAAATPRPERSESAADQSWSRSSSLSSWADRWEAAKSAREAWISRRRRSANATSACAARQCSPYSSATAVTRELTWTGAPPAALTTDVPLLVITLVVDREVVVVAVTPGFPPISAPSPSLSPPVASSSELSPRPRRSRCRAGRRAVTALRARAAAALSTSSAPTARAASSSHCTLGWPGAGRASKLTSTLACRECPHSLHIKESRCS